MAKLLEEMKIEVDKKVREIKEKAKIEKVESMKDIKEIIEKQFSAEVFSIDFINSNTLGMICVNNGELTILLNRNSMYSFDSCYTALYLLGYYIFQERYVYAYIYDENCDIIGEKELKASYFAEQLIGL